MDEQSSEICVAAFTDSQQPRFTAGGVLFRHQSQPCCEIASLGKGSSVADSGDQCRCSQGTDTGNLQQSLARCVLAGYAVNLAAQVFDLFFQRLSLLPQPIDQPPHTRR